MPAPSLLKFLNVSVGVGVATLGGLAVTAETGIRSPAQNALSIAGNVPTISVQLGPTSDAGDGELLIEGQTPFLLRTLIVAPGLPDSEPETNDLTPTLIWQDTPLPGVGLATMQGLAPAVVGDTGQNIGITQGLVTLSGLAPTLSLPSGQNPTLEPDKAETALTGFEPTLFLEIVAGISVESLVLTGLQPTLVTVTGWTTVEPESGPVWLDIPRV